MVYRLSIVMGEKVQQAKVERKYTTVMVSNEDAKYLDEIKEKILSIICMNKEGCVRMYSRRIMKTNILSALITMAFFDEDVFMKLIRRVAIFDEYTYNVVMEKIKEYEERKEKKEEEECRKKLGVDKPKQPKVTTIVEECKDPPEVCAERWKKEIEAWKKQVFDVLGIDESEVS